MNPSPFFSRRQFLGYAGASFAFAPAFSGGALAKNRFTRTRANMAAAVKDIMTITQVPSLAYALVGKEGVIWAESVGLIDKLNGTAPSADTLYCIGSCSKVFAVAAVMKLVEQGKIDIDKPFVTYVPEFRMLSDEASGITVRMLMSHSSGFPGSEYRGLETTAWHGDYPKAALATLSQSRLKHTPGEMSVYCNDGFTMLELLVLAVSGTPFPDFVRQEILLPLGMTKSHYGDVPIPAGGFAPAYDGDRRLPLNVLNAAASGGLYTNPKEWGRFLTIFLNEGKLGDIQVLSPESVRRMAENQSKREPFRPIDFEGFGLGWDSVKPTALNALGITAWRKNGGTQAYTSDMIAAPDAGLAVVVTAAAGGFDVGALSERLLFEALTEQGTIKALPMPLTGVVTPATDSPADPAWFEGAFADYLKLIRFEADPSGTINQFEVRNGVWIKAHEGLRPRSDGSLASDSRPEVSYRILDYKGISFLAVKALVGMKTQPAELVVAQKLRPKSPLSAAWKDRLKQKWLVVNQPEDNYLPGINAPALRLSELLGLEGYVVLTFGAEGEAMNQVVDPEGSDSLARMCLKIPFNGSRDLNDVVMEKRADGEWLHFGSWLGQPIDTVPVIGSGTHEVEIGSDGTAQWRKLATATPLDIKGATTWGLHATDLRPVANGTGDVSGLGDEDAGYVVIYGKPGSSVTLILG